MKLCRETTIVQRNKIRFPFCVQSCPECKTPVANLLSRYGNITKKRHKHVVEIYRELAYSDFLKTRLSTELSALKISAGLSGTVSPVMCASLVKHNSKNEREQMKNLVYQSCFPFIYKPYFYFEIRFALTFIHWYVYKILQNFNSYLFAPDPNRRKMQQNACIKSGKCLYFKSPPGQVYCHSTFLSTFGLLDIHVGGFLASI